MPYEVEAFGKIIEVPDDVSHADAYKQIMANKHKLGYDEFTDPENFKTPNPEALDYAKGFAAGANKLVSGVGYLAEAAGAKETGKAIREFGDRGATYWNSKLSPGGKKAAESQVFVDDPESITGLRLGDDAGKALLMGASQSLPSMFAAALPGVAITKGIQALASLGLAGGAGATIPLLAGTAAPVGTAANVIARVPSAIGFGAAEGIVSGAMNAAEFKSSIEGMSDKELSKSPVYLALKAEHGEEKAKQLIADQAASDIFGRTALSTGAIGAVTGGGALGQAYQKATTGAADGIVKSFLKGAGQEAIQETPQSAGEKYIENLATKDYINPDVDTSSGVLSSAASGGAVGAFTGGIFGAGSAVNITTSAQQKADRINAERAKLGLEKIVKATTVDEAINAANESVSQKPVDKEDVLRVADPTLADIERLTGLKPSESIQEAERQQSILSQAQQENNAIQSDIEGQNNRKHKTERDTEIVLPDNKTLNAQWDIVDADNVKASLKNGESQPRDRTRAASDLQIQSIAKNPDYRRLSDSPVMDIGAPVLSNDGQIVGGNGRFEAISRAYDQDTAQEYIDNLKQDAIRKGIDPAVIDQMKKPVLVRRISQPFDTRQLAIASNSGMSAQYSDLEQAKIDSERLKGLEDILTTDNGDIALTADNIRRVRDSLGNYSAAEIAPFVDANGQLSQQGMKRIRNAILAKAYGDNPILGKIIESTDSDMRNIAGALMRVSGDVAKVRQEIKQGAIPKELDITDDLIGAVEKIAQLRSQNIPIQEYLSQQDIFGNGLSDDAKQIVTALHDNIRSQNKIAQFIRDVYDGIGRVNIATGDMLGNQVPSKGEVIQNAKPAKAEQAKTFSRPDSNVTTESGQESKNNDDTKTSNEKINDDVTQGKVGMMLSSGQVVKTLSGRLTTPFPAIKTGKVNTGKTTRAVEQWLMQNALEEALSRNDKFNARIFKADIELQNSPQASKDSAEEYLFGYQPEVQKPFLKPLNAKPTIESQLEKHLKKNGYEFDVKPVTEREFNALSESKKAQKELAEKQAKIFGKKVVFVKTKGKFGINGVMVPAIKDTIFIDLNTPKPFHAVMAHELSHWMEQENPKAYKDMLGALKNIIINEEGYRKKYNIDDQTEGLIPREIAGDLMGDNFTKPEFWKKVAEYNPSKFKEIAQNIIKWLKNIILKAKTRGMGSEEWVTDAKKAQDIIAKAVSQYTKQQDAVGEKVEFKKQRDELNLSKQEETNNKEEFPKNIKELEQSWDAKGISNFISEKDGVITLSKIVIPKEQRNNGIGTSAMNELIDYADRTGQRIALTPSSDFGGNKSRLLSFYKRFGFVENTGRNKDYSISEYMYRDAKSQYESTSPQIPETITIDGIERPTSNNGEFSESNNDIRFSKEEKLTDEESKLIIDTFNIFSETKVDKVWKVEDSNNIKAKSIAFQELAKNNGYEFNSDAEGSKYFSIKNKSNDAQLNVRVSDHSNVNRSNHFGDTDINLATDDGDYPVDTFASALYKMRHATVDADGNTLIDGKEPIRFSRGKPFNNDETVTLYHGGEKELFNFDRMSNPYRSTFASVDKQVALSHGDNVTTFEIPKSRIAPYQLDSNHEYTQVKDVLLNALDNHPYAINYLDFDDIYDIVVYEDEKSIGENDLYENTDLMIELQALRADVAADLGYWAVKTHDEHGTSYQIVADSDTVRFSIELDEFGEFKTGVPVTFNYLHNKESATELLGIPKNREDRFGRFYEPSGKYIIATDDDYLAKSNPRQYEFGQITFNNPLVIKNNDLGWKKELSDKYNGLRGKNLSKALIADGYDGVVTVDKYGTSEILDLTSFDESKAKFSQQKPFNPNEDIPETKAQKAQRIGQDKFNRFKVIKEWLAKERGINLSEAADVYGAEERYYGKVANQQEDFREKIRNPLIEKISKAGYKLDDVEQYLLNRHAQEANVQNRKLTGKSDSTAYGIPDEDAEAYLAKAPKELAKLADEVQSLTDKAQQLRLDNGIETQERVNAMKSAYQYYVPVRGDAESQQKQNQYKGTGKGFSMKYKPKRRLGHELRNESVIENIFQDYERAIIQVEDNRMGKSLALMAAEIQMPELISIDQPVKRKILRTDTAFTVEHDGEIRGVFHTMPEAQMFKRVLEGGLFEGKPSSNIKINKTQDQRLIYSASPMLADNEVMVYMNGHEIRLQINDELLARAYKNMGTEALGNILSTGRAINGWMSKAYTGYNPYYILVNLLRDFQTGFANLTGEQGILIAGKAVANYPKSFASLLKYAFNGKSDKWIDAYRDNGGNTGAAYLPDLERLGEEVKREYASYQGVIANLKEGDSANALRAAGRKAFNATLKYINHLNAASENAFRVATFKAMVESGKSVNEAASMAKNVTVNFNRKGELGSELSALYLFFNPSIQGTAATSHALFKGRHKYQAWGLVGSMMTIGYMMASMLGGFDDEDKYDEISDATKSRNLIMAYGDGYLKIPIPYGYGFFYNAGRMFAEAQRKGELGKMPYQLMALAIEEFSPFNVATTEDSEFSSKKVFYGFLPTMLKIPAEITNNFSSFTNRELYPEKTWYKSEPDNEKMWRGTKGTVYDISAQYLASIGVEISPEVLKYMNRTATGGSGAFVDQVVSGAMLKSQGAELEAREIPFVNKFYGENTIQDARARYGKAKEEARIAFEKFSALSRKEDLVSVEKFLNDKDELLALNDYANSLSDVIRYIRDQQDEIKLSDKYTTAEKRLKIKELEKEEKSYYDMFMKQYKTVKH